MKEVHIQNQIEEASRDSGIELRKVSPEFLHDLWKELDSKFQGEENGSAPKWEALNEPSAVQAEDAWEWLSEFPVEGKIFMLFEPSDYSLGLEFDSMESVTHFLGEGTGWVYYLTNSSTDFLLCENDHQFLIGAGKAKDWVKEFVLGHHAHRLDVDILNYQF